MQCPSMGSSIMHRAAHKLDRAAVSIVPKAGAMWRTGRAVVGLPPPPLMSLQLRATAAAALVSRPVSARTGLCASHTVANRPRGLLPPSQVRKDGWCRAASIMQRMRARNSQHQHAPPNSSANRRQEDLRARPRSHRMRQALTTAKAKPTKEAAQGRAKRPTASSSRSRSRQQERRDSRSSHSHQQARRASSSSSKSPH
jgi:hypothetical protein